MSILALIKKYAALGIIFFLNDNGGLTVDSPEGMLTSEHREVIKQHKSKIIKYLQIEKGWMQVINNLKHPSEHTSQEWFKFSKHLTDIEKHVPKFIEYGYTPIEVFGCHKDYPWKRIDHMGAALFLNENRKIEEVRDDIIIFRTNSGATQTVPRSNIAPKPNSVLFLHNPLNINAVKVGESKKDDPAKRLSHNFKFPDLNQPQSGNPELWQAMNQIVLDFIDQSGYDQASKETQNFILRMYEHYKDKGMNL